MALISTALFREVRAALDIALVDDVELLPDTTIGMSIFLGEAERQVIEAIPTAQALVDADDPSKQAIQRATVCLTAALLAPRIPWLIREDFRQYRHDKQPVDVPALVASLRKQAATLIQLVTGEEESSTLRPWAFKLAPGGRGA